MRFLPHTKADRAAMLKDIGADSVDALYADVPEAARRTGLVDLPLGKSEMEVEALLSAYANENHAASDGPFFLGAGCYYHHIPSTVDMVIQRSEYLTAYTPYQPEISQGTLAAIFEFQSMVAASTGQEIANASMYDGATSVAEAALMARRVKKRDNVVVQGALHPDYLAVLETYFSQHGGEIRFNTAPDEATACVIVQTPDYYGTPQPLEDTRKACDAAGAMLVVAIAEFVSLGMLPAPSEADIVAGEAQSIGVPMSFGGPHLGFFATKKQYVRQMPGRLVGRTSDVDGKDGYVLTLNTREQHIRREKATSNICSNQGLMALAFTVHLSLLGEVGFKQLALSNHERACTLADELATIPGVKIENESFFNEFVVLLPKPAKPLVETLAHQGIIAGFPLAGKGNENKLLVCATEMTRDTHIETFCRSLAAELA